MVKEQLHNDNFSLYCGDCMHVLPQIESKSIDLSIYSPPFCGLYQYTSLPNDFSNCASKDEFLQQYEFLVKEISRITKSGRITAVHCTDILNTSTGELWDFPHEIIMLHKANGFKYMNRITIWKEPLTVKNRTMVKSLMHKQIVDDSTKCFTAMPDYLLIFKKTGENETPVTHEFGLINTYYGSVPLLPFMIEKYGDYETLRKKYAGWKDPKTNKLSHVHWQRYASSVWDDIRIDNVVPFRESKEEDDEKHIHPLQLDVIDRIVELYSNPNEIVLTPFMGVGSEVYSAVSLGRKAIGIELKESYYKQSVINCKEADKRFLKVQQATLFE